MVIVRDNPDEHRSVAEAKRDHHARKMELTSEYIECEVCGCENRVYRWTMYKTAVDCLVHYYRLGGHMKPVDSKRVVEEGHKGKGDEAHLVDFRLLRKIPIITVGTGERSSYYMITDLGRQYLEGRAHIPRYIWLFGKHKVFHESEERVYVHHAKPKFNLDEMLRNRF